MVRGARGAIYAVLICRSFPLLSAGQNPNKKPGGFPAPGSFGLRQR
jgi:hypothetical protein